MERDEQDGMTVKVHMRGGETLTINDLRMTLEEFCEGLAQARARGGMYVLLNIALWPEHVLYVDAP